MRHHWSDKDLVKGNVESEVLRTLMGSVHGEFVRDGGVIVVDEGKRRETFTGERFAGEEFAKEAFGKRA